MAAGDHVPARLRVLSANLWNGRAHPDGFAALVERMRADVVAVQEMARRRRRRCAARCRTASSIPPRTSPAWASPAARRCRCAA
jgi:endonuclease/exonuclease/phosphatase family metal-dependent hydrolase